MTDTVMFVLLKSFSRKIKFIFIVKFIPGHLSILHVEQEVVGDETLALQSVLESDTVRESLLAEEISINKKLADG